MLVLKVAGSPVSAVPLPGMYVALVAAPTLNLSVVEDEDLEVVSLFEYTPVAELKFQPLPLVGVTSLQPVTVLVPYWSLQLILADWSVSMGLPSLSTSLKP